MELRTTLVSAWKRALSSVLEVLVNTVVFVIVIFLLAAIRFYVSHYLLPSGPTAFAINIIDAAITANEAVMIALFGVLILKSVWNVTKSVVEEVGRHE